MSIVQGLRKVTLATAATPGLHRIGASQCFRFIEGARLRSGSLLAKWPGCLRWFAGAMEIDVTGNLVEFDGAKVAPYDKTRGRGRQCSVPPWVTEASGSVGLCLPY